MFYMRMDMHMHMHMCMHRKQTLIHSFPVA